MPPLIGLAWLIDTEQHQCLPKRWPQREEVKNWTSAAFCPSLVRTCACEALDIKQS